MCGVTANATAQIHCYYTMLVRFSEVGEDEYTLCEWTSTT